MSILVLVVSQVITYTIVHLFHQAVVVKVDPTLKLVFICKFSTDTRHVSNPGIKILCDPFVPFVPL
jgi:hypothetical protein